MIYSHKHVINNGIKYFVNFGKYSHFSVRVIGEVRGIKRFSSERWSTNSVDGESDVVELMVFDSRINKNATNSTSGRTSINSNVVFGVKPISLNAAYVKEARIPEAPIPDENASNIFFLFGMDMEGVTPK